MNAELSFELLGPTTKCRFGMAKEGRLSTRPSIKKKPFFEKFIAAGRRIGMNMENRMRDDETMRTGIYAFRPA